MDYMRISGESFQISGEIFQAGRREIIKTLK
jgi:hypothetical protein